MYEIVDSAVREGPESVAELAILLDHPVAAKWIAHQLIERAESASQVREKCFAVIERLSLGDDAEALGEQMWLEEYSRKRRST